MQQNKLQGLVRSRSSLDLPTGRQGGVPQGQHQSGDGLGLGAKEPSAAPGPGNGLGAMPSAAPTGPSSGRAAAAGGGRAPLGSGRRSSSSCSPLGRRSVVEASRRPPTRVLSSSLDLPSMAVAQFQAQVASHGVLVGQPGSSAAAAGPMLTLADMADLFGGGGDSAGAEAEAGDDGMPGQGQQGRRPQAAVLLGGDAGEADGPGIDPDLLRDLKAVDPTPLEAFGSVIGTAIRAPGGIPSSGCNQQELAAAPFKPSSLLSGRGSFTTPVAAAVGATLLLPSGGQIQTLRQRQLRTPSPQQLAGFPPGGASTRDGSCPRPEQLLRLLSEPPDLVGVAVCAVCPMLIMNIYDESACYICWACFVCTVCCALFAVHGLYVLKAISFTPASPSSPPH